MVIDHDLASGAMVGHATTHKWSLQPHSYVVAWPIKDPGPRLNIKTVLSTYGDFHVKDKTAVRTSYL